MNGIAARRRAYKGPLIFSFGFRPFFFSGAVFAGIAVPLWALMLSGLAPSPAGAIEPFRWHAHEMVFGYLSAVVAGFLLTAIPNWTGRLPVMGMPLAALFGVWLAGRIAVALAALGVLSPLSAAVIDLSFLVAMAGFAAREVVAGKNWRNLPVVGLLSVLGAANLLSYLPYWTDIRPMLGEHLALAGAAILISLIGGRITPSFTRNWLAKGMGEPFPASFGHADRAALALTVAAMFLWALLPEATVTGVLLALAGMAQLVRLSRWRGERTGNEPLVLILHVGYGWLVFAILALAASILAPQLITPMPALHALTAGAVGTMTLAVMTRATLGHTGRALTADRGTVAIYVLVNLGAALRVAAGWLPLDYVSVVTVAGMVWSAGFLLFAVKYGSYLLRPRLGS